MSLKIVVAGATGDLGRRICRALLERKATVHALARSLEKAESLRDLVAFGLKVEIVSDWNVAEISKRCSGAFCVVSALLGLEDVMIHAQQILLDAAIASGVPRFIPSDYCMDYRTVPVGTNRNLDLHRSFDLVLQHAPIQATSIFNGAFMDLLTGHAPFVLFKLRKTLYWQNADQVLDFTTRDNTAQVTAAAALDLSAPRYIQVVGDQVTARDLAVIASDLSGMKFRPLRGGSLKTLDRMIRLMKWLSPQPQAVFPPWQGMQYTKNMFAGEGQLRPVDNSRYPEIKWTRVREYLGKYLSSNS